MKQFTNAISGLFLILVIAIIGNITLSAIGLFFNYDIFNAGFHSNHETSINTKLIFAAKAIALLIFIVGVYVLIGNLKFLIRRDFFNSRLIQCFSKAGILLIISGIMGFVVSIADILNLSILKDFGSQLYLNIDSKSLYIMLMILGLFLKLFSRVLNKGNQIQQENDLTI